MSILPRRSAVLGAIAAATVLLLTSSASGHVSVAPTALSIQQRGGPVSEGDTVTITGKLAGPRHCRPGQTIQLLRVGSGVIATTTTDAAGRYRFEIVASEPMAVQAHFGGSGSGVHPHSHLCAASTSRVLRVKIRQSGGGNSGAPNGGSAGVGTDVLGEAGTLADRGSSQRGADGVLGTAFTGSDVTAAALAAVVLFGVGGGAIALARRRKRYS